MDLIKCLSLLSQEPQPHLQARLIQFSSKPARENELLLVLVQQKKIKTINEKEWLNVIYSLNNVSIKGRNVQRHAIKQCLWTFSSSESDNNYCQLLRHHTYTSSKVTSVHTPGCHVLDWKYPDDAINSPRTWSDVGWRADEVGPPSPHISPRNLFSVNFRLALSSYDSWK